MSSFDRSIVCLTGETGVAIAIGAALSLGTLAPAQAVTFRLSWMGQILGYGAGGQFSSEAR